MPGGARGQQGGYRRLRQAVRRRHHRHGAVRQLSRGGDGEALRGIRSGQPHVLCEVAAPQVPRSPLHGLDPGGVGQDRRHLRGPGAHHGRRHPGRPDDRGSAGGRHHRVQHRNSQLSWIRGARRPAAGLRRQRRVRRPQRGRPGQHRDLGVRHASRSSWAGSPAVLCSHTPPREAPRAPSSKR